MSRVSELHAELALIKQAASEASEIVMGYFRRDVQVTMKPGNSPVTEADLAADRHLRQMLMAARPDYGWLSEETADNAERLGKRRCFIVDPIDGTKAFIAGRSQWCISIGLVEDGISVAGVLDCPARGEVFEATKGGGAWLDGRSLDGMPYDTAGPVGASRFAGPKDWVAAYRRMHDTEVEQVGHIPSLAYRLACVADRRFEGTFIKPNCHDWDIAAAAVILEESRCQLLEADGAPARFNRAETRHGAMIGASKARVETMLAVVGSIPIG